MRKSLLLLLLLVSCAVPTSPSSKNLSDRLRASPWTNTLRALDPADASTPFNDITAVYLRTLDNRLQIRIDLLDFKNPNELSLDIRIEDDSAPQAHPHILHIPSQTESARVELDPQLATVNIEVLDPPSSPRVDISTPEDQIDNLTLDSPVVTQTTPLLLTFYDTFAARLPAEALRSWDGAHTGPRGERHGLKHLLDAVEKYQIPVVLLDLKEPENLSALDAMGLLPKIEKLENKELVGFPKGNLGFVSLEDSRHLYQPIFSKTTYIPISTEYESTQPTQDGPPLDIRRTLLDTVLNDDKTDLLILGGSLADSTWGSPDMVGPTLAYFVSRPYINILNGDDLINFPTNANNTIVSQPEKPIDDKTVQAQSALAFAQEWAQYPPEKTTAQCKPEFLKCTLANNSYLGIFDPQTASLTFLFARDQDILHQLIGPSWQVAPGIDIFPGAFADGKGYQVSINSNSLVFTSNDSTRTKAFSLKETGLSVSYQTKEPVSAQIPLLVNPDTRFTPGWANQYIAESTPDGIRWGLKNGPMVSVEADGAVKMRAFNEDLSLLQGPEDPDYSYPPGHYVPFPMAILGLEISGNYVLSIERK